MKARGLLSLLMAFVLTVSILGFSSINANADDKPYFIKVNRTTNVVTVYGKDNKGKYTKPVKAFVCSTGLDTPVGTFKTPNKFRWQPLQDDVWGQYCTQITGNILFHSVWYYEQNPGTLSITQYNNLGTTCSHGCIRLTCGDAKWIYDNCPLGTTVNIFNGSGKDDPLGKPKAMKINIPWDPTDTNPDNPWLKTYFKLNYKGPESFEYGSKAKNLTKYVTMTNVRGETSKISGKISMKGNVNTKKTGAYKVTFSAKDCNGKLCSTTVSIKVVDTKKPVFKGLGKLTIERNAEFSPLKKVSARMVSGKKLKKNSIEVSGNVNTGVVGNYRITYKVKGVNGKVRKRVRVVKVVDTKAPVISGLDNQTLTGIEADATEEQLISMIIKDITNRINVTDNGEEYTVINLTDMGEKLLNENCTVDIASNGDGQFIANVIVKDKYNNESKASVVYSIQYNQPQTVQQTP